ncbi:ammonia channel protein [Kouleothrix aurantiaca]|jgi:Amt family ammonium transporter|uniref:Ammonium transporter n=1 Tax=Kouleothrix aurantiaca TaxID=186479 RepID=A0A0P9DUI7_9CHLR|nr:ammonia channel protein [Kouleothrix aurantiaca]
MDAINGADTAWVLISAALVMLMTPALGLFYGGMVRGKNVLSTIMHSFFMLALISVQWVLIGYSLAFGPSLGGFIGGLDWIGLNGVGLEPNPDYAATIPHQGFMVYQLMFAAITPALISGAFAERKRFKAFVIFSLLWSTLVYAPVAHWVWGVGGWIRALGALDFAGGTVVHITSGVSALVCAIVLGKRLGYGDEPMQPHNVTMTVLGTALLWFGWFGFNAGSALGSGALSVSAFVTTNTAAAMAALTWMTASWVRHKQPSVLGAAAGAVAGLVGITPAAGFVTPMAALIIGFLAGLGCFLAVELLVRGRVDDALDVFGVHGVGGIIGALATGIFATKAVNAAGADGLLYGNPGQLGVQALAIVVVAAYAAAVTWGLLKILDATIGLRVSREEEHRGLDTTQHGEVAYQA